MVKNFFKTFLIFLMFSIIYLIVGDLLSFILSKYLSSSLQDTTFIVGIVVLVIGVFSIIGGNPNGLSLQGLGLINSQYISLSNLEHTQIERDITNYHENFKNHINFKLTFNSITIILGGILIILSSIIIG